MNTIVKEKKSQISFKETLIEREMTFENKSARSYIFEISKGLFFLFYFALLFFKSADFYINVSSISNEPYDERKHSLEAKDGPYSCDN